MVDLSRRVVTRGVFVHDNALYINRSFTYLLTYLSCLVKLFSLLYFYYVFATFMVNKDEHSNYATFTYIHCE